MQTVSPWPLPVPLPPVHQASRLFPSLRTIQHLRQPASQVPGLGWIFQTQTFCPLCPLFPLNSRRTCSPQQPQPPGLSPGQRQPAQSMPLPQRRLPALPGPSAMPMPQNLGRAVLQLNLQRLLALSSRQAPQKRRLPPAPGQAQRARRRSAASPGAASWPC